MYRGERETVLGSRLTVGQAALQHVPENFLNSPLAVVAPLALTWPESGPDGGVALRLPLPDDGPFELREGRQDREGDLLDGVPDLVRREAEPLADDFQRGAHTSNLLSHRMGLDDATSDAIDGSYT